MIPIPADRMNIMRSILLVCLFCICIGCIDDSGKSNTGNGTSDDNGPVENVSDSHDGDGDGEIVIFLTGETLGQLKPCGCTAGQLGGFEKRKTVLDAVDSKRRLLLDTGHLIEGQSEQNILKYNIIIQALSMLGYDAVNFNSKDVEVARDHIGLDSIPFAIISGSDDTGQLKSTYSRKFKVNGKVLQVTVASVISEQISGDKLSKLFLSEPGIIGLNILLVDSCEKETLDAIALEGGLVDVVVCPTGGDEPDIVEKSEGKPLVISAGRLGKYVGKLRVKLIAGDVEFAYESIAINGDLKADEELAQLYRTYQQILKDDNYLAKVRKVPLPGGLKYVGSDQCQGCHDHDYNYEAWSKLKHAHAYQTLVEVNAQYDPECIECHVIGLRYENGFFDEKSPKGLRNVGCETCHGPGSQHIEDALNDDIGTEKDEPVAVVSCIECHTSEHSPGYQADVGGYWGKIVHWKEPNQDPSVK